MNKLVSIFTIAFALTGLNLVLTPLAEAGCNAFGCSQSSRAECNPFGCPQPGGEACTPFGCPSGKETARQNSNNDRDRVNSEANNQTDFQFCVEKLEEKGYSTPAALKECRSIFR